MKTQTQLWPKSLKRDSGTAKAWATLNPQSMEAAGVAGVVGHIEMLPYTEDGGRGRELS